MPKSAAFAQGESGHFSPLPFVSFEVLLACTKVYSTGFRRVGYPLPRSARSAPPSRGPAPSLLDVRLITREDTSTHYVIQLIKWENPSSYYCPWSFLTLPEVFEIALCGKALQRTIICGKTLQRTIVLGHY